MSGDWCLYGILPANVFGKKVQFHCFPPSRLILSIKNSKNFCYNVTKCRKNSIKLEKSCAKSFINVKVFILYSVFFHLSSFLNISWYEENIILFTFEIFKIFFLFSEERVFYPEIELAVILIFRIAEIEYLPFFRFIWS